MFSPILGKPQQIAGRSSDGQTIQQPAQEIENTCGNADISLSVQSNSSGIVSNPYNIAPPPLPYTYTQLQPALYNHAMVPFYYPIESEQNLVPLQYYPQYAISSGGQEAAESTEPQPAPAVCPLQQSESNCFPSYALYPPSPAPLLFQQPQAGMYPRWVQPASSPPHMTAASCMFQPAM